MLFSNKELAKLNNGFQSANAKDIIQWAVDLNKKIVVTTNFGPHEAAILHTASQISTQIPIICIDHGYNTDMTYQIAQSLTQQLNLNIHYFTPRITRRFREVALGGVPNIDDVELHTAFTQEVKLEPFKRAFAEFQPDIWLTAIRKEQTAHRASLDILTHDKNMNCLKVAPFFHWSELDMEEYLVRNDLPIVEDYYDPTKVLGDRECGLHSN